MADLHSEVYKVKLADGIEYELVYTAGSIAWLRKQHNIDLIKGLFGAIKKDASPEELEAVSEVRQGFVIGNLSELVCAGVMDSKGKRSCIEEYLITSLPGVEVVSIITSVLKACIRDIAKKATTGTDTVISDGDQIPNVHPA